MAQVPPEKLRRRAVRARLLGALTSAARWTPSSAIEGALVACAPLARWTSFERTTRANLALALGAELDESELAGIARGVRRHAARQFASWLRLASCDAARAGWIDDLVAVDGSIRHLDDALARGRGVIVATAHLGDWELLAARIVRLGHRGAVVGLRRANDPSARWFEDLRARHGLASIAQSASPRELLAVLARGEVLGLLCDLDARRLDAEILPFFAMETRTLTAPAALARASGAAIVPARCVWTADGHYALRCEPAFEFDVRAPRDAARRDVLVRLNAIYERWIRETPEQWAWHQKRWPAPARGASGAAAYGPPGAR